MRIKIFNRNLETEGNYTTSKIYNVTEGSPFTNTKMETLDSGTVIIDNQLEPIEIEPYDIVAIYDGTIFKKLMCVDTYTEQMVCINPKIYRYEIKLFSETKLLEGIILPNLKITKVWNETRSLFYYIDQYMDEYCPKIRIYNESTGYQYNSKFKYNKSQASNQDEYSMLEEVENKFSDECPEMQWNTPTLREVLNDLMMVKDCIPILRNGVLYFMDLTEVGTDVSNDEHINYVTKSKSSEDYVSELQCKLENVINKTEGVNNITTKVEYIPFSINEDDATMTSNNVLLKTQYPIYNLKKLVLMCPTYLRGYKPSGNGFFTPWSEADLLNLHYHGETVSLVYEYKKWLTKNIAYNSNAPENLLNWPKYQNWTLYYTRGTNEISNFSSKTKFLWMTNYLRQELCYVTALEHKPEGYDRYDIDMTLRWYTMFFKVEYETYEGCLFRASKNDNPEHTRVVIDNQTNSMVDSYAQGFLEYQKANRLGNKQLQINARYPAGYDGHILEIGDIYEDSVIYQCQYQYFSDHTEVNAIATKDYILRDYFTGVKSKIRSWAIVSGSEALTRHDLEKYYCEFSYGEHIETQGLSVFLQHNVAEYFLSPLEQTDVQPLSCCFVRTTDIDLNHFPENYPTDAGDMNSYYCLDLMSRIVGNSLVLTFEFLDNYSAGQSVHTANDFNGGTLPSRPSQDVYVKESDLHAGDNGDPQSWKVLLTDSAVKNGGVPMYQHKYANENGEFIQGQVIFGVGLKIIPTFYVNEGGVLVEDYYDEVYQGTYWCEEEGESLYENSKKFIYALYQRPRVYESNIKWSGNHTYDYGRISVTFDHHKDSQEIINLSTQIEFSTDTNDICFSKEFMKRQQAVNIDENSSSDTFYLSIGDKDSYNFRRPDTKPDGTTEISLVRKIIWTPTNGTAWITFVYFNGTSYYSEDEATAQAQRDAREYAFYLEYENSNNERKLLLSFRNVPITRCVAVEDDGVWYPAVILNMNILRTRNKNIYDDENRYLIVRKI